MTESFIGYDVEFSLDGKNWQKLEGVVMDIPALNWDLARPVRPKRIWRNAGVPYVVAPGYQWGSIDQCRSVNAGYRKHSNVLRINSRLRHRGQENIVPDSYDWCVAQFYID